MQKRQMKVNCPTCNEIVVWCEESEYRPFCSKRCKLIDFGDWANERHTIPGAPLMPDDDEDDDKL